MFGLGGALLVIILWARFAFGKLDSPFDQLQVSPSRITSIRLLSAGFPVVALLALTGLVPGLGGAVLHLLAAPLGIAFCVPGLIAIHRLRAQLGVRRQSKPVMAWLDRGVLAGWCAVSLGVVWGLFSALPFLLPPVG